MATEKQRWRLGFYVTVEADGFDATDAWHAAEIATGWPGDWRPPHAPVEVEGSYHDLAMKATLLRSQLLSAYPIAPPVPPKET